jgi:hypothetical protein
LAFELSVVKVGAFTVTVIVLDVIESPEATTPTKPCAPPVIVSLAMPAETVEFASPVTVPPPGIWEKVITLELS